MPSMPPLSTVCVTQSSPLLHSGVDSFGPLFIKTKNENEKGVGVPLCMFGYKASPRVIF